ncbi:hypothetical protein V2J09_014675 [Rumex salicifolius]
MDSGIQIQEKLPADDLKKHLAVVVRDIQWSYSIFWSISSSDPRQLEWSEGYYNGDIKTRKTVQAVELDVDQLGLQRSEQLRELYESLLVGETNPQAKRPSAALSPEDLSNTEWYYLVCMSFVFDLGQGLPGRTFQNGKPLWLCNAHQADSKVFGRSLLAKTVVCFPFLGGVVELGVTDLIPEDFSLIQYVQASLLGTDCPERPNPLNDMIPEPTLSPIVQGEDMRFLESLDDKSSNGFGLIQPVEETEFMFEDVNGDLMDDELSNSIYTSLTSSECISLAKTENVDEFHPQGHENPDGSCLLRMESDTQHQWSDDLHYQNVISSLSKSTRKSILDPSVDNFNKPSCFVSWKKGSIGSYHNPRYGYMQRVLKKVLIEVPRMYKDSSFEVKVDCESKDDLWSTQADELASGHVLAERKRWEKVNDRFSALKSLIPLVNKVDKVSILDDTINHIKELKRRVEELEKREDINGRKEGRRRMKPQDMVERTSDNYKTDNTGIKRRSSDSNNEENLENSIVSLRDSSTKTNLSISVIQKDVLVEIKCPWKECLLFETIDALRNLRLDTHSVQSSTSDSFLSLTIKAKINGPGRLSAGLIRQVLQRVLMKSC